MSIFTKPLSQLGTPDLQELLQQQAVENVRLEFKLEVPTKDETLKKLSSFANTFGGFIVVGAKADSADGRIQDLPGVLIEAGYKQKLVQWCFDGASPPLIVEVSDPIPAPTCRERFCYVAYTAESDLAPHFLNGRKGVWVRTDEFSARFEVRLANENELRHLLDRRSVVRQRRSSLLERSQKRFDTYASRARAAVANKTGAKPRSILQLCVIPRFPVRPVCEQGNLKPLIMGNFSRFRGFMFPYSASPILSQHESAIILGALGRRLSMFEASIWGMLFFSSEIEAEHTEALGIHLYELVGTVLLFIHHASKMLKALAYSGPILIETGLGSILGVKWLVPQQGMWLEPRSGSDLDDSVTFSISTTTESLQERPDDVAMDVLRYIFFAMNLSDLTGSPQIIEQLVRRGYEYNSWPHPAQPAHTPQ